MPTSSKQQHRLCSRNTDVDVNDTQFTVTCHISLYAARNRFTRIHLKGTSFTQTSPQPGFNMQRCRKMDPVCFVLGGILLQRASLPAVKYSTTKQPVRWHTALKAAQVTKKPGQHLWPSNWIIKEGNSFIKYSANYAQQSDLKSGAWRTASLGSSYTFSLSKLILCSM